MRKTFLILSSIFMCVGFHTLVAQSDPTTNQNNQQTTTKSAFTDLNLIFVQSAKSAILKELPKKPGFYTLTLYNTPPYIAYFAERPNRVTGLATFENFKKAWSVGENSFKINNPNAVLCAAEIDGLTNQNQKFYLMTLSNPLYSIKNSIARYTIKPLSKQGFLLKQISLKHVNLIIDNNRFHTAWASEAK